MQITPNEFASAEEAIKALERSEAQEHRALGYLFRWKLEDDYSLETGTRSQEEEEEPDEEPGGTGTIAAIIVSIIILAIGIVVLFAMFMQKGWLK